MGTPPWPDAIIGLGRTSSRVSNGYDSGRDTSSSHELHVDQLTTPPVPQDPRRWASSRVAQRCHSLELSDPDGFVYRNWLLLQHIFGGTTKMTPAAYCDGKLETFFNPSASWGNAAQRKRRLRNFLNCPEGAHAFNGSLRHTVTFTTEVRSAFYVNPRNAQRPDVDYNT